MLGPRSATTTLFLLTGMLVAGTSSAQLEDQRNRKPVDCISIASIDDTEVIDDRTVLFFMRGESVYRNYLAKTCPGLDQQDGFSYRTTSGRLCKADTITVLERAPGRPSTGFTCALGEFRPMSTEDVDEVSQGPTSFGRNAIEVQVVELPRDEPETAEEGEDGEDSNESLPASEAPPQRGP
jgi:hypothetical protein